MWADKVRYGFAGFRSTASPDRIAKSPVVDIAHARFRKNDCRVPQEKFRVQDSTVQYSNMRMAYTVYGGCVMMRPRGRGGRGFRRRNAARAHATARNDLRCGHALVAPLTSCLAQRSAGSD